MHLNIHFGRASALKVGQLITLLTFATAGGMAQAEEELRYVELMPTFVTNFGYEDSGRLSYLKADVSLRVTSRDAEMALRHHLPLLRDALVLLLSRQSEADVATSAGREQIRLEAIDELQALIVAEEGEPYIKDLMFTNFILQR